MTRGTAAHLHSATEPAFGDGLGANTDRICLERPPRGPLSPNGSTATRTSGNPTSRRACRSRAPATCRSGAPWTEATVVHWVATGWTFWAGSASVQRGRRWSRGAAIAASLHRATDPDDGGHVDTPLAGRVGLGEVAGVTETDDGDPRVLQSGSPSSATLAGCQIRNCRSTQWRTRTVSRSSRCIET